MGDLHWSIDSSLLIVARTRATRVAARLFSGTFGITPALSGLHELFKNLQYHEAYIFDEGTKDDPRTQSQIRRGNLIKKVA